MKYCECGCGQEVKNRFVNGHARYWSGKQRSKETKNKISISKKGTIPWNYVDGIQSKIREWAIVVKERDGYTCQVCKEKIYGNNCIAHHIKSKESYPDEVFNFDNGVTLCRFCHTSIHHKGKTQIAWNKGLKGVQVGAMNGKHHSEEAKKKISKAFKGKPWTFARREAQNKRRESRCAV